MGCAKAIALVFVLTGIIRETTGKAPHRRPSLTLAFEVYSHLCVVFLVGQARTPCCYLIHVAVNTVIMANVHVQLHSGRSRSRACSASA